MEQGGKPNSRPASACGLVRVIVWFQLMRLV
jgi:hypothetical protein